MRVTRVYHAGRSWGHRARERALAAAGVEVTLIVPREWPEGGAEEQLSDESFEIVELDVERPGDVNRHTFREPRALHRAIEASRPDLLDVHEEPFSAVMRQVLSVVPAGLSTVGYAAQNLDKQYPPPFSRWERAAYGRLSGIYPCSRQAASVLRRRGYAGLVSVLDLGYDEGLFVPGAQVHAEPWQVALVGRFVPEKGLRDAVEAFGALSRRREARLVLAGSGPLTDTLPGWIEDLGLQGLVHLETWLPPEGVAELYRASHAALVPSRSTPRWLEQYGRMIVEAQASGAVVVGYASGSIGDVAQGAAMLAAEGDTAGLGRALTDLASNARLWDELRARGLTRVRRATWDQVAQGQLTFYELAASRDPLPATSRKDHDNEFGHPARLRGINRPHSLPILRDLSWRASVGG